jgi:hypothetical protein
MLENCVLGRVIYVIYQDQPEQRASRSYMGPTPIVQDGDLVIRRNGERLAISTVTYKMPRGVILQQDFDVELLPPGDTRYLIPLAMPQQPIIYNPAVVGRSAGWQGQRGADLRRHHGSWQDLGGPESPGWAYDNLRQDSGVAIPPG